MDWIGVGLVHAGTRERVDLELRVLVPGADSRVPDGSHKASLPGFVRVMTGL